MTVSMQKTIDETNRRREKQIKYNIENDITPRQMFKSIDSILGQTSVAGGKTEKQRAYIENTSIDVAADPVVAYMSKDQIAKAIQKTRKKMEEAVKELDFISAAQLRDELFGFEKLLEK
jgi:excinuclease ABC subunit B